MIALGTDTRRSVLALVSLVVLLGIVGGIRLRLLEMPLERDEGEYGYAGQVILAGESIYQHAYPIALKFPGTSVAYAGIMGVFGDTAAGIRAGLLAINLATAVLVFLVALRICGRAGAVAAAGTYALLSISPAVLGLAAHANHFVLLPALAGILLLQDRDRLSWGRILVAGLLLGTAIWMKQPGAAFGAFALAWLAHAEIATPGGSLRRLASRAAVLLLGLALPMAASALVIWLSGDFDRFFLWSFRFAAAHGAIVGLEQGALALWGGLAQLFRSASGLCGLAIVGLVALFVDPQFRRWRFFVSALGLASFLAVSPGLIFREHYFLLLLPALGLLVGVAMRAAVDFLARSGRASLVAAVPAAIFAVAVLGFLLQSSDVFFRLTPAQVSRAMYGVNPFPEAAEIARYLEARTEPDARIAVVGSEPEIYFYSRRRAATGYIVTYALMEPQPFAAAMQREMIEEIEANDPDYVVFVRTPTSWVAQPGSDLSIFDWFSRYQQERLEMVGLVTISPSGETRYHWDVAGQPPAATSENWLAVFRNKRRGAAP